MERPGLAVLAIGGNALIRSREHESIPDQYDMVCAIAEVICGMLEGGWKVVVTHGNGPQVGFILRRSELSIAEVPPVPMDYAGADIQGAVGYMFVKALRNVFKRRRIKREAVAVVTQTVVDRDDPAFTLPALDFAGTPACIDARRVVDTGILPVINTGIAHKEPGVGQIGAGVTRAPLACFTQAVLALAA